MSTDSNKIYAEANRFRWHRNFALISGLVVSSGILIALRPSSPEFRIAGIFLSAAAVIVGMMHALKARKCRMH